MEVYNLSIPVKVTLFIENDAFIEIDELHDGLVPATYFNAALVTATLKNRAGTVVDGVDGITLSYIAASNGKYRGAVQESFNPATGGGYKLEIVAIQAGVQGKWVLPAQVKIRTGQDEDEN